MMEKTLPLIAVVAALLTIAAAGALLPQEASPPTSIEAPSQETQASSKTIMEPPDANRGEEHPMRGAPAGQSPSGHMGEDMGGMMTGDSHGPWEGAPSQGMGGGHMEDSFPGPLGPGEPMMGPGMGGGEEMWTQACSEVSAFTPQENIMWLLQNHDRFNWSYAEYPDNYTVRWLITADSPEAAQRLYEHILQMECILENGGSPRRMDPVFRLESMVYEYIHTNVTLKQGNVVEVVKTGEAPCAYEVIKLHAQVVQGFFEKGMEEARRIHPVPPEVASQCEQLVGDLGPTPPGDYGRGEGAGRSAGHGHGG